MNVNELKETLVSLNISDKYYSILTGGLPNEKLCIVNNEVWAVYYSERGQKTGLKEFSSEAEACEYFLRKLLRYSQKI